MSELLFLCAGVFVGAFFSMLVFGLCAMAKHSDETVWP